MTAEKMSYYMEEARKKGLPEDEIQAAAARINVKPPDYSDAGNADIFSKIYKNEIIFVDALGWLWWNGQKWERDDHKATGFALKLSEKMLQDAIEESRESLLQVAESTARHAETEAKEDANALKRAK